MHDHNPTDVSTNRSRWTEDRVERLLLSLFAEQPIVSVVSDRSLRGTRAPQVLLIAAAAVCLAIIVPVLSARVGDSSDDQVPLARWVGPQTLSPVTAMNLAANDDSDAMASETESSISDSDETAEAPATPETEESAST